MHPVSGAHPGVLIWPDAFGLRPAKRQMARRLAESGYSVLVVNQYYRSQRAPIVDSTVFSEVAGTVRPLMGTLNAETHVRDAEAFVGFLDSQSSVDSSRKMGTMGYCMGGPITMRTAAALPDRVGAGASFHGGGLVTDQPDSPHLLVPQMTAHYLFAISEDDDEAEPEAKNVLREAFAEAGLPAEIEGVRGGVARLVPARHAGLPRGAGGAGVEPSARPVRARALTGNGQVRRPQRAPKPVCGPGMRSNSDGIQLAFGPSAERS